jgi:ADP-ribose pyrophosphatase YjhB (NUDIX family)
VRASDTRPPEKFYREHLRHFPLATVDIVVTDRRRRFLLLKRSRENLAWKGVWATPGGRIFRNERVRDAAHRVLLRETGLQVPPEKFELRGVGEIITTKEHGVTAVFSVKVNQNNIKLDKSSSSARWFTLANAPETLTPEYATILKLGGVPSGGGG